MLDSHSAAVTTDEMGSHTLFVVQRSKQKFRKRFVYDRWMFLMGCSSDGRCGQISFVPTEKAFGVSWLLFCAKDAATARSGPKDTDEEWTKGSFVVR